MHLALTGVTARLWPLMIAYSESAFKQLDLPCIYVIVLDIL